MTTTAKIHDLQKFQTKTIHRNQIKEASYNPRTIDPENKKLLGKNLEKRGLLETLVWNKKTGNLVSGHRRLEKMDAYHKRKYKNTDYQITVACVELTIAEEKEQNIFFNNPNAQGNWDRDLLLEMIPDIDLGNAGFTEFDLNVIGIELDLESNQIEEIDTVINNFEKIKDDDRENKKRERELNPDQKDWKEVKKNMNEQYAKNNAAKEDYVVITFDSIENKGAFLDRFGFEADSRYIKGELFHQKIKDIIN